MPILWPLDAKNWLIGKDPDTEKDWRQEEKGTTEDEMVGWHHQLNGHEFEQGLGVGDGQGGLVCCSPWGRRVGHDWATEQQEYLTTYNTLRYFLFSSVLSIGYQCIPCWLWYSLEKSALILISNTYLARSECDLHSQKILPGYGCALFRYWRGWVASTMDVSHAGSHTTSVWWQSFILFHSASFVPVSCLVAECHGSLWGNGWVILWME